MHAPARTGSKAARHVEASMPQAGSSSPSSDESAATRTSAAPRTSHSKSTAPAAKQKAAKPGKPGGPCFVCWATGKILEYAVHDLPAHVISQFCSGTWSVIYQHGNPILVVLAGLAFNGCACIPRCPPRLHPMPSTSLRHMDDHQNTTFELYQASTAG